jgi:hypothetical protein
MLSNVEIDRLNEIHANAEAFVLNASLVIGLVILFVSAGRKNRLDR